MVAGSHYLHHAVLITVMGTGLTLPVVVEPYSTPPFLHAADRLGIPFMARLKEDLP